MKKIGYWMETYASIEELKLPKEHEDSGIIILDALNQKEKNDPRIQAMFKRSNHKNYLYSKWIKIFTNYPKRRLELLETSTLSLDQTVSEIYEKSIRTMQAWIGRSTSQIIN